MTAPITLAIDAATYVGSVAVLRGDSVLAAETTPMRGATEEGLMPAVAHVLERAGVRVGGVERVVCGEGPGSFTSLRIAASIAKGIALGVGCALVAVPSLALVIAAEARAAGEWIAAVDALRGEHYVVRCAVDEQGIVRSASAVERVATETVRRWIDEGARVAGPGCPVEAMPRAEGVARMDAAEASLFRVVDLESWEPAYGRLAEAQVKWEAAHGRALPVG